MKFLVALVALFSPAAAVAQSPAMQAAGDPLAANAVAGSWSYAQIPGGSEAVFLDSSGRSQLTIRCNRSNRRVSIIRPGSAAAAAVQVWTSSAVRQLPASFDLAGARISADLAAFDPLLDAMAFSRGRFAVGVSGFPPLVVPAWPEATRAIEDCRN